MEGGGFGLIGDLIVGLIGAFIGDWLLPRLGVHLGTGIVSLIINALYRRGYTPAHPSASWRWLGLQTPLGAALALAHNGHQPAAHIAKPPAHGSRPTALPYRLKQCRTCSQAAPWRLSNRSAQLEEAHSVPRTRGTARPT